MAKEKANSLTIPPEPGIYSVVLENFQALKLDVKYIFDNAFVGYDEKGWETIVPINRVVILARDVTKTQSEGTKEV